MELKAKDQAYTSAAAAPPPCNRDVKSLKLPAFINEKDEMDIYLLHFERFAENAKWGKHVAIKQNALFAASIYQDVWRRC